MAASAAAPSRTPQRLGLVLTDVHWALRQTEDGRAECPDGFNAGPREQFDALYPARGRRTVADTVLRREAAAWFPDPRADRLLFREAGGDVAPGLDLDGRTGAGDFTAPDGTRGVDNQLFRAIGCIRGFRGPGGVIDLYGNKLVRDEPFSRLVIEITGIDDLREDPDVQVTTYRGLDPLQLDASAANVLPGGTQRVDARWGAQFVRRLRGRIHGGVLTTEPADVLLPWSTFFETWGVQRLRGMRLQLKVGPDGAEGVIGGYVDVDTFYFNLLRAYSTHHQGNAGLPAPSLYGALERLADGYPEPGSDANTAISGALTVKFAQVFVAAPQPRPAAGAVAISRAITAGSAGLVR